MEIVKQSVKDIVIELNNEGEILSDKFGTSSVYWSFPSTTSQTKKSQLEKFTSSIEKAQTKLNNLMKQKEEGLIGREDTQERRDKLEEIKQIREEITKIKSELEQYKDNDPELLEAMSKLN